MSIKGITQNRNPYDLSHFSMNVGAIGHLQTLACVPVVAGDSMQLNLEAVFRLSPLRRPLYLDATVDLFAFYVPHRHVYGSDWLDFIKQGVDETVTFGSETNNATTEVHCLGTHWEVSAVMADWQVHPYMQIWNRYFKQPGDSDVADNFFNANTDARNFYGLPCCFPKRVWNTGRIQEVDTSDSQYTPTGLGNEANHRIDLIDFAKQQGRYKSELKREWFGQRYADLMNELFGSKISHEVEPYPYLIQRSTSYLSGYETDGTSGDSMGMFQARSVGVANLRFPSRFFNEHGSLWIMALVRFPPLTYWEKHYLAKSDQAEPTYKQIAGDPDMIANEGLIDITGNDLWYKSNDATVLGRQGYGWWYREHPHFVHPDYQIVSGHPFLDYAPITDATAHYYTSDTTMYDDIFSTLQLKHWQCQAHVGLTAKRLIPDPRAPMFAGTR